MFEYTETKNCIFAIEQQLLLSGDFWYSGKANFRRIENLKISIK